MTGAVRVSVAMNASYASGSIYATGGCRWLAKADVTCVERTLFSARELQTERSGGCCSLAQRSRSLPYCQPIFLRGRRYDPVHPQILHDLSIMIGYVPHRRDRNPQPRIRPGVRPLDTHQSVLRIDGCEHAVAIVE